MHSLSLSKLGNDNSRKRYGTLSHLGTVVRRTGKVLHYVDAGYGRGATPVDHRGDPFRLVSDMIGGWNYGTWRATVQMWVVYRSYSKCDENQSRSRPPLRLISWQQPTACTFTLWEVRIKRFFSSTLSRGWKVTIGRGLEEGEALLSWLARETITSTLRFHF